MQKGSLVTYKDATGLGNRGRAAFRVTSEPENGFAFIREVTKGGVYHPNTQGGRHAHTALLKNFVVIDPNTFLRKDADRTLFPLEVK